MEIGGSTGSTPVPVRDWQTKLVSGRPQHCATCWLNLIYVITIAKTSHCMRAANYSCSVIVCDIMWNAPRQWRINIDCITLLIWYVGTLSYKFNGIKIPSKTFVNGNLLPNERKFKMFFVSLFLRQSEDIIFSWLIYRQSTLIKHEIMFN